VSPRSRADEGNALTVLFCAWCLADEHQLRAGLAVGEDEGRRRFAERAAVEGGERLAQLFDRVRSRGDFLRRAHGGVA
jgi:hypothetical protein